jgi:hypothetical protein
MFGQLDEQPFKKLNILQSMLLDRAFTDTSYIIVLFDL